MKIKTIIPPLLLILFSSVCAFAGDLTVAVAANVQYTFEELKAQFQKETGINIKSVIGSSGKFTAQIENGAPFDVFLSADMDYPKTLQKEGLTYNDPKAYAYGTIVLWAMNDVDLSKGIEAVGEPEVRKIAIASPNTAPYGRQAVNALKYYHLYDQVDRKLVYGESIAQVNQFVISKAADLGFTAKSIVLAAHMKTQGTWVEIEKGAYEPVAQGVVILKHAQKENLEDAQKFFDFLFSDQAGEILKKYGYVLP
ncbi:MAG: molybdate ABC transporter substrate-binding protein [Candidatus Omnitrophica bacterium]|nr:molybdate ABC transporter substrate-binding protein [Candidatus Omnitrophota bacterium]